MDAAFLTKVAVYGAALPLAAGTAAYGLGWLRRPRTAEACPECGPEPAWTGAVIPLALAAFWPLMVEGWTLKPVSVVHWVPWVALAAGVVAALWPRRAAVMRGAGGPAGLLGASLVCSAAAVYVALRARLGNEPFAQEAGGLVLWIALGAVAIASLTLLGKQRGATPPMLLVVILAASARTWSLTGHINPPLAALVMGAAAGGAVLIAWRRPALRMAGGAWGAGVMLALMLPQTAVLGETPAWCNVLLVVALVLAPATAFISERGGVKRHLVRIAIVAIPAAAAVVGAMANQPAELEPYEAIASGR